MSKIAVERILDRCDVSWLTPSEKAVWDAMHQFDGPPHRVVNLFGGEGTGKTFIARLMERTGYASYLKWPEQHHPQFQRIVLDGFLPDRDLARDVRPWVDRYAIRQIILVTRLPIPEPHMPGFGLEVTATDMQRFRATIWQRLNITLSEDITSHYQAALEAE